MSQGAVNQGYEASQGDVPKYPENPMKFEGYGNVGVVTFNGIINKHHKFIILEFLN